MRKGRGFPGWYSDWSGSVDVPSLPLSCETITTWKNHIFFFFACKAVKIHTCKNTYPGWGCSEIMLTFPQMCARLRQRLTRVQPSVVPGSAAAKRCWAMGSWTLGSAPACSSAKGCSAETVHGGGGLHLSFWYAFAAQNTPQCSWLVRSGLKNPVQQVVVPNRSGMTHAEVRHQHRSRDLLHPSGKHELKVRESAFSLSDPNPSVKIDIVVWQRKAL